MHILKSNFSKIIFYKEGRKYAFAFLCCLILSASLGGALPFLMSKVIMSYDSKVEFTKFLNLLTVLFVGTFINRSLYNLAMNKYVVGLIHNFRSFCYEKWLLNFEIQTSEKNSSEKYTQGEVLSRIMTDTESIRELVTSGSFGILIDIFFVLSSLLAFISLNQLAGGFLAIVQIGATFFLIWSSKYMRETFSNVRKSQGRQHRKLADLLGGVKESYYLDSKEYASKSSVGVFDEYLKNILKSNIWDASFYSFAESLFPVFLVFAVFIVPFSNITEIGLIFAFIDVIQRSIGPIKEISAKIANIQRALTGITRINEFIFDLETKRSTNPYEKSPKIDVLKMLVDVQDFSYPVKNSKTHPFSLKNIQFNLNKGELLGIVGLSGSGKSTLLKVLCGDIIPDVGTIKIIDTQNNIHLFDLNDFESYSNYRSLISIVSQESHIFSENLKFNITMGEGTDTDFETFWKNVILKVPYLEDWGVQPQDCIESTELSLGQKQLVAAIRSCYLKRPIVLFDEISSSLDANLELALRKMILLSQENSLTIIVAHRVETIVHADLILLMQDGQILDQGVHKDLNLTSSIYQKFINLSQGGLGD